MGVENIVGDCFSAGCYFANPETGKCEAYLKDPSLLPLMAEKSRKCVYAAGQNPVDAKQLRHQVFDLDKREMVDPGEYVDRELVIVGNKSDVLLMISGDTI